MNGNILLNRKILEWEWYTDINTKVLFIHLLLRANWKDANWKGITVKRGQLVTSIQALCSETALTPREVRTALDHLKLTGEIDKQTTSRNTVITVLNYDRYQTNDKQNDILTTNERQLMNKNNKNNNISCAPESHDKKTVDEIKLYNFEIIYKAYPKKKGKQDALKHYLGWISKKGRCIDGIYIRLNNDQIYKAVKKYVNQMQDEDKELQYYQDFSRFMNRTILDYVEDG